MSKVQITLKAIIPLKGEASVTDSPAKEEGVKVIKVGENYYMPALDLMVYEKNDDLPDELNVEDGSWVSLEYDKFNDIVDKDTDVKFDYEIEIQD